MRDLKIAGDSNCFKLSTTGVYMPFGAFKDDGRVQFSSNNTQTLYIKNASGFVLNAPTKLLADGTLVEVNTKDLSKLTPDTYYCELWDIGSDTVEIYPDNGFVEFTITENATAVTGDTLPSISLSSYEDQLKEYIVQQVQTGLSDGTTNFSKELADLQSSVSQNATDITNLKTSVSNNQTGITANQKATSDLESENSQILNLISGVQSSLNDTQNASPNILYGTADFNSKYWFQKNSASLVKTSDGYTGVQMSADWNTYCDNQPVYFDSSKQYTVSAYIYAGKDNPDVSNMDLVFVSGNDDGDTQISSQFDLTGLSTKPKRFSVTFTGDGQTHAYNRIEGQDTSSWSDVGGTLVVYAIKLEVGSTATPYINGRDDYLSLINSISSNSSNSSNDDSQLETEIATLSKTVATNTSIGRDCMQLIKSNNKSIVANTSLVTALQALVNSNHNDFLQTTGTFLPNADFENPNFSDFWTLSGGSQASWSNISSSTYTIMGASRAYMTINTGSDSSGDTISLMSDYLGVNPYSSLELICYTGAGWTGDVKSTFQLVVHCYDSNKKEIYSEAKFARYDSNGVWQETDLEWTDLPDAAVYMKLELLVTCNGDNFNGCITHIRMINGVDSINSQIMNMQNQISAIESTQSLLAAQVASLMKAKES